MRNHQVKKKKTVKQKKPNFIFALNTHTHTRGVSMYTMYHIYMHCAKRTRNNKRSNDQQEKRTETKKK